MDAYAQQLTQMRALLLRQARARLRNPEWAEDAVSETLLAALEHPPAFGPEPAPWRLRAWLLGVLRHKATDQLRRHLGEERLAADHLPGGEEDDTLPELRDPHPHANPPQRLAQAQFVHALAQQLAQLPRLQARAFVMRECWGDEPDTICDELGISSGHLWVVLHRARRRLRAGLAAHAG